MQEAKIGFLSAYKAFWAFYVDFRSRTSKEAFWKAWCVQAILLLVLNAPAYYVYMRLFEYLDSLASYWLIPAGVYAIATFLPMLALIIRRLHDIDRHGCYFFLFLIPVAGVVIFFILLSRPSAPFDVYPGYSGGGPYALPQGTGAAQPRTQQGGYAQTAYGQPYTSPQGGYAQAPYGQRPYAPPQYGQQGAYMYAPPQPRRFAPAAGGNNAFIAIVLSILLAAGSYAYNVVLSFYILSNIENFANRIVNDLPYYSGGGDVYPGPYSDWGDGGYFGLPDSGDYWDDFGGDYGTEGDTETALTEDQLAAIDFARSSTIEVFPAFTIEEVLFSRVDSDGLEWDCYAENPASKDDPVYTVTAYGFTAEALEFLYCALDVYADGTIEIYNLSVDELDLYGKDALALYEEWYGEILKKGGKANAA